jgi:oligopeptide transport system ATP-binding protein
MVGTSLRSFAHPTQLETWHERLVELASVPIAEPKAKKLAPMVDGDVPSPINPPSGCAFHTRCRYVMDRCKVDRPALVEAGERHEVACWLNDGTGRPE